MGPSIPYGPIGVGPFPLSSLASCISHPNIAKSAMLGWGTRRIDDPNRLRMCFKSFGTFLHF
jgi:hypothetical protein